MGDRNIHTHWYWNITVYWDKDIYFPCHMLDRRNRYMYVLWNRQVLSGGHWSGHGHSEWRRNWKRHSGGHWNRRRDRDTSDLRSRHRHSNL